MNYVFYERRTENFFVGAICDHPFPAHVHDVVEIVCLQTGSMEMTIGGRKLLLMPGDIAIAFPAMPHSYDYVSGDASGLSMIFQPDAVMEFYHTFRTMQPVHPLLVSTEQIKELGLLVGMLQRVAEQKPGNSVLTGYLHLFLSYLFTCLKLISASRNPYTTMTYQVLQYVSEHFTEPLTLETTARALGISRIHLSHIFSQQLHINFRQYINTLRIGRACNLLRDPAYSISQIAYQCGYGNQRTFHRAFLAQCGVSPNQYRSANRSDSGINSTTL